MALPASITAKRFPPTGIEWRIELADLVHRTRVQRAPDASGSPGTYEDIAVLPEGQSIFRDLRLLGSDWWYRFRHEADGETNSAWTTDFCATAVELDGSRQTASLSVPAAAKISSAGTISVVNAAGAASSIPNTLRFGFADLTPNDDAEPFSVGPGYLHANSLATRTYFRYVALPKGVTIAGFRARLYRQTVSDLAEIKLWQGSDTTATATTIATLTHSTTGWQTVSNTSLNQVVGDETYTAIIQLFPISTVTDARFLWFEVIYNRPDFAKVY